MIIRRFRQFSSFIHYLFLRQYFTYSLNYSCQNMIYKIVFEDKNLVMNDRKLQQHSSHRWNSSQSLLLFHWNNSFMFISFLSFDFFKFARATWRKISKLTNRSKICCDWMKSLLNLMFFENVWRWYKKTLFWMQIENKFKIDEFWLFWKD